LAALLGWAVVAVTAENPNGVPPADRYVLAAAAAAGALTAVLAARLGTGPALPSLPGGRTAAQAPKRLH
ncbi:MAG: hypothetical protein ACRDN6_13890, partial [Gaiellaceae bacterium]